MKVSLCNALRVCAAIALFAASPWVDANPPGGGGPLDQRPGPPDNLRVSATAATGTFTLDWNRTTGSGYTIAEFDVERNIDSRGWARLATGTAVTSISQSNLGFGPYQYQVRACSPDNVVCTGWVQTGGIRVTNINSPLVVGPNFGRQFLYSNLDNSPDGGRIDAVQYFASIAGSGSTILRARAGELVATSPSANAGVGPRGSFSNWLQTQNTLMGSPAWVGSTYYNDRELGIGRGMYCAHSAEHTACYVVNCGSTDDGLNDKAANLTGCFQSESIRPEFDLSLEQARAQVFVAGQTSPQNHAAANVLLAEIKAGHPGAAVAMEWDSDPSNSGLEVQFFAFDYIRNYAVTNLKLDRTSLDDEYPGTCLTCHAGHAVKNGTTTKIAGAHFLPFDIDNVAFAPGAKDAAKDAFTALNKIVAATEPDPTTHISRAIDDSIGYLGNYVTKGFDRLPPGAAVSSTGSWTDGIWKNIGGLKPVFVNVFAASESRNLYRNVVRPYCSSCHLARNSGFLDGPGAFLTVGVAGQVCGPSHKMPKSELAEENFYNDPGARLLLRQSLNKMGVTCEL